MPAELRAATQAGHYQLLGSVTFENVHTLAPLQLEPNNGQCHIDLSGLEEADSSVLALLVGWLRRLHERHSQLEVAGLSPALRSLIHLYNLEPLFPAAMGNPA